MVWSDSHHFSSLCSIWLSKTCLDMNDAQADVFTLGVLQSDGEEPVRVRCGTMVKFVAAIRLPHQGGGVRPRFLLATGCGVSAAPRPASAPEEASMTSKRAFKSSAMLYTVSPGLL